MKELYVVAAIIKKDNKILATQRGYGEFEGLWEFPGGKIEEGETKEEALVREIKEELNADILVEKFALDLEWQYPNFYLYMSCFECVLESDIELLEHMEARWLSLDELDSVEWIQADIKAVNYIKESLTF
ncbi:MAG: (deoxy)nucleoside triphosphate pyrophosphohydrolase [Methanobrevibacter ruminantium]|uniref:(deoxy)nucleoside triphosphate pyrophosphohydrolase n=1 Tax=Methanobrevibacter ruminantium TaxID=83816 RepID=UPI0026ECA308|nr:(deoxy)nucleoside triphosphate pyrophosphohydrolase [Methanobrevibacter ruminantium]MDD6048830.1 (deoxy)nucleoside triphosphate pyrophosphohydrolase [Methanobrevibacter ruminantium]